MALKLFSRQISGLLMPKPYFINNPIANCTTKVEDETNNNNDLEVCDEDYPVTDMDNPYQKERRQCVLCKSNITPSYKNTKLLSQFVSMYTGKIYGRHITGLCRERQQQVETEISKAQNAGMMPYYLKDPAFMQDPQLFNPDTPFRNHPY